jgi:hypothetical protein
MRAPKKSARYQLRAAQSCDGKVTPVRPPRRRGKARRRHRNRVHRSASTHHGAAHIEVAGPPLRTAPGPARAGPTFGGSAGERCAAPVWARGRRSRGTGGNLRRRSPPSRALVDRVTATRFGEAAIERAADRRRFPGRTTSQPRRACVSSRRGSETRGRDAPPLAPMQTGAPPQPRSRPSVRADAGRRWTVPTGGRAKVR